MDFAVQILFVGRPLHVSQRQTCERYRHRQWDGFCCADFILSSARFKFLKAKRASVIGIGNGMEFAVQILFCRPPALSFSKAKRASGTQENGWIVSDGLNLIARLFYVRY